MTNASPIEGLTPQRLEQILLLCTAPREQIAYDGWLVRRARDDVKRARSVNAAFGCTKPLAEKIERCERLYADYDMPPVFRLTPFSTPPSLDNALDRRGYVVFEPSVVRVTRLSGPLPPAPDGLRFQSMLLERWVEDAGLMRGLSPERRAAEFDRLHNGEAPGYCSIAYAGDQPVACGLVIHEEEFAGLFDIFVVPEQRGRGIGTAISAHLLRTAQRMGARIGWLSVLADNAPALAAYTHLGFETLYPYWYRVPGSTQQAI